MFKRLVTGLHSSITTYFVDVEELWTWMLWIPNTSNREIHNATVRCLRTIRGANALGLKVVRFWPRGLWSILVLSIREMINTIDPLLLGVVLILVSTTALSPLRVAACLTQRVETLPVVGVHNQVAPRTHRSRARVAQNRGLDDRLDAQHPFR